MAPLLRAFAIVAGLLVAGCTSGTQYSRINVTRQADTGIIAGERVAVLLSRYSRDGVDVKDLGSIEEALEQCIRTGMQPFNDNLAIVPPADLQKVLSADTLSSDASRSPDSLLRSLGEPVAATRLAEAKVRYVLLLEVSYSTSKSKWEGTGLSTGTTRQQSSSIQATVLDLKHARIAGSIHSSLVGSEGEGVGVHTGFGAGPSILVLPVPIIFDSRTESRNCADLGKRLVRFISGYDQWQAELNCDAFGRRPTEYSITDLWMMIGNTVNVQHGVRGKPGWIELSGTPEPDGRLQLAGAGIADGGSGGSAVPYKAVFDGKFAGGRYEGVGQLGAQNCTLTILRGQK